jgi:hypothetical protein
LVQAGQEDAAGLPGGVSDDRTVSQFKVERGPDKFAVGGLSLGPECGPMK